MRICHIVLHVSISHAQSKYMKLKLCLRLCSVYTTILNVVQLIEAISRNRGGGHRSKQRGEVSLTRGGGGGTKFLDERMWGMGSTFIFAGRVPLYFDPVRTMAGGVRPKPPPTPLLAATYGRRHRSSQVSNESRKPAKTASGRYS